jgi:Helix-turn-helix domain
LNYSRKRVQQTYVACMAAQKEKPEPTTGAKLAGNPEATFIDESTLIARLGISRGTAINHRRAGILPYVRIGRAVRYHWDSVQQSLLRRQQGGAQ